MPVIYSPATKTARMTATRDRIDAGGAAGKLEICTAGYAAVLATIPLGYPGNATGTVAGTAPVRLTLAGFPRSDAADNSGVPAVARIRTSDDQDVITGLTVGLTDADVILDSLDITAGQQVIINSAVFDHA